MKHPTPTSVEPLCGGLSNTPFRPSPAQAVTKAGRKAHQRSNRNGGSADPQTKETP